MKKEQFFILENSEIHGPRYDSIFLCDEFAMREVFAHELRAFFEFKDQLEMMDDDLGESSFNTLVKQAEDLHEAFQQCKKIFQKKKAE